VTQVEAGQIFGVIVVLMPHAASRPCRTLSQHVGDAVRIVGLLGRETHQRLLHLARGGVGIEGLVVAECTHDDVILHIHDDGEAGDEETFIDGPLNGLF